jgi:hypothetical protein
MASDNGNDFMDSGSTRLQTSRLRSTAAAMKDANSGWGSNGLDFSSG